MMRMLALQRYSVQGCLLLAVVVFGSLSAMAQGAVINVNDATFNGDLAAAYDAANDGDVLVLGRPIPQEDDENGEENGNGNGEENGEDNGDENGDEDAPRITVYPLSDTLLINKSLTIRGDSALLPSEIEVRHDGVLAGPVFEIGEGVTVTLEGITLTGGTAGALAGVDATLTINRCYLIGNTESGVELNNVAGATITNSSIVNNNQYGVRVVGDVGADANHVQIGQSTFIGNGAPMDFDDDGPTRCTDLLDVLRQWREFVLEPTLAEGVDDISSGDIPIIYLLTLMREVVCEDIDPALVSAVRRSINDNLAALEAEDTIYNQDEVDEGADPITVAEVLEPYHRALAAALALNDAVQTALLAQLDANGLPLNEVYVSIRCDYIEEEPEAPWDCDDATDEPFSDVGDIDRDELTNAEEYDNVVANGGNARAFARAAIDPTKDGSEIITVPDVIGETLEDAVATLDDLPLGPIHVSYQVDEAPLNEVIAQDPPDGPALEDTPVFLVVSLGNLDAAAVSANAGSMSVYASLFYNNYNGIVHQGGNPIGSWGNYFEGQINDDFDGDVTIEVAAPTGQTVALAGAWIGKLDTMDPIESGLDGDDYPDALAVYNLDFERDRRGEHPQVLVQVGADEVGEHLLLGLGWLNAAIVPDPAFTGDEVRILIELGTTGLTADNVEILIRPQTLPPGAVLDDPSLLVPVDSVNILDAFTLQGFITIRDGLVPNDVDYVIDGEAQVYLLSSEGLLYGVGTPNEEFLAPGAFENSFFVIDNTPPVFLGGIRANQFIINSNDDIVAPPSLQPYPSNWAPAAEATPASGVQLATLDESQGEPQIFFNQFPGNLLEFDVVATFEDRPPEGFEGIIQPAGFSGVDLSIDTFLAVAFRGGEIQLSVSGGEELAPNPADKIQVGATQVGVSAAGYPTLSITWEFRNLDYVRDETTEPPTLFNNDWRLTGQFRVVDGFESVRVRSNRFHMWWMHDAVARITSSKYDGRRTADPTFTWGLERGRRSPQNAFPAYPIAQLQVFSSNGGAWNPVGAPSPWLSERTIDRFTVINADTGRRLGDLLADFPQGTFGIAIIGGDEAGNVQEPGLDWGNADFDFWVNEPQTAAIDTNIQGRFWYFDAFGGLPDRQLGPATRIMMPNCDQDMRINGEFLLRANAPGRRVEGIAWRFYRNGELIDEGLIPAAQGELSLMDDLLGLSFLRDALCQNVADDAAVERTQEFVLEAAGVSNGEMDPSPASYRFFVVADLPLLDDQPIKETMRE